MKDRPSRPVHQRTIEEECVVNNIQLWVEIISVPHLPCLHKDEPLTCSYQINGLDPLEWKTKCFYSYSYALSCNSSIWTSPLDILTSLGQFNQLTALWAVTVNCLFTEGFLGFRGLIGINVTLFSYTVANYLT